MHGGGRDHHRTSPRCSALMSGQLVGSRFDGIVWRYIPAWSYPLHAGFLLQAAGRWNRYNEYGCLYTALTRDGAIAEYAKVRGDYVGLAISDDAKRDLVTILVTVTPVLDLTDAATRERYAIDPTTLVGDEEADLETCRSIADLARAEGYRAILSPSAALAGGVNLNIYDCATGRTENL